MFLVIIIWVCQNKNLCAQNLTDVCLPLGAFLWSHDHHISDLAWCERLTTVTGVSMITVNMSKVCAAQTAEWTNDDKLISHNALFLLSSQNTRLH